jgi:hypothetical protein
MNTYQRIYDLLVEAQINEVAVYRSTSSGPNTHPYLQATGGRSEYAIRNTKGKMRNIDHPEVVASAKRGAEIRAAQGLPPRPSLRERARRLLKGKDISGNTRVEYPQGGGTIMSARSRGHGGAAKERK